VDEIVTVEADEKDEEEVANAVNVTVPVDDTAAVLLGVLAEDDDAL